MRKAKNSKSKTRISNQLRIIGGQWRGRKLDFADGEGLRPTMDRVRETLFNWLQGEIIGARCLDLFTGSGALGLEALSRAAAEVVMIDKNPQAVRMIQHNLDLLAVENAQLLQCDAEQYLQHYQKQHDAHKTFDIVFLDPPFNKQLVLPFCHYLDESACLSEQAVIYIEMEKKEPLSPLPAGWEILKEKKAGQSAYYLIAA